MVELDSLRFQSDRRVRFCQMLPGLVCVAVVAVGLAPALAHGPEGNTTVHIDGRYVVMRREGEGEGEGEGGGGRGGDWEVVS